MTSCCSSHVFIERDMFFYINSFSEEVFCLRWSHHLKSNNNFWSLRILWVSWVDLLQTHCVEFYWRMLFGQRILGIRIKLLIIMIKVKSSVITSLHAWGFKAKIQPPRKVTLTIQILHVCSSCNVKNSSPSDWPIMIWLNSSIESRGIKRACSSCFP